ncbi:MAG: MFS transporter [Chloroflexi bacterium]|nr:MFS transporter [Chloroflexota bacterium]
MIKRRRFPRVFFGWWTVLASGIISFWGLGYHLYGFSALFKPIATELGFNRAVTSVAVAIGRLQGGIEGPVVGGLTDKFGPKWVLFFGIFLMGLSLILMYFVNSLWTFYLVWGVLLGTSGNIALMTPINKAIGDWFVKKRGLAQGIRWGFRGLSGVLVLPLIAWLIITQGWRMTCVIGGVVMLVIGLPLTFLFKRYRPEYYGLLPDGARVTEEEARDTSRMIDRGIKYAAEVEEVEFTLRQALRTPSYWLLIIAFGVHALAGPAISTHAIPFLTDIGIEPFRAAGIYAIIPGASIPARLIAGLIIDRIKKQHLRFILGGIYLLQAVGITIFLLDRSIAMIYVWFILYGFGQGAALVLMPLIRARYFGRKALGSIGGFATTFSVPVVMASPIYFGWVYDTTGNYNDAFTLLAVLLAVAVLLAGLVAPPKPPAQVTDIRKFV